MHCKQTALSLPPEQGFRITASKVNKKTGEISPSEFHAEMPPALLETSRAAQVVLSQGTVTY
jgi:hypothetical protein